MPEMLYSNSLKPRNNRTHIRRKVQSEQQGTSQSTLQGASNKKSSRCQLCEATDNKTPSRCEKKKQLSLYVIKLTLKRNLSHGSI
ncbi:hypothetical protein TSPI_00795 [Trichinella spiralis]|uniref:Uncharacterized protein n=1 Tax=Trichinella spiralis TaxID=6334 RepID=A0ABR3K9X0_TRISP